MPTTSRPSRPRRWFGAFWRTLDATRRLLLNLLLLAVIVALITAWCRRGPLPLADQTALVLQFEGPIVEQNAIDARQGALARVRGDHSRSVQLRDLLTVIQAAAGDPKIGRILLRTDELGATGLVTLREVGAALDRFRASGKKVVAWGSDYNQRQYLLAVHADEVLMHPYGTVLLDGFGRYRNYYRDALDKLGVTVNLVRVGTYKSFAEPYIANGPSPAAQEAERYLNNGLWATYTGEVEAARKLAAGSVMRVIDDAPARLAAVAGDPGKFALAAKLVDALVTEDELRASMIERGARSTGGHNFRQVSFDDYLERQPGKLVGDAVGVVIAEGEIVDGDAPAGTIGGRSTAALIRQARDDRSIKSIVLRVDSPGGSVLGAELVRRELELTRAAGKPVVVSMGNVAASGGYWISTASDEVIADPATVTGSIGVFALFPTADKALDKVGVHTAGTTTTWLGGAADPRRPADPRLLALIQQNIDHVYVDFTSKVAAARKTSREKIDAVGQGRVWTGAQAKDRGLVDRLGSYADALKSAATRANLGDGYRVEYIEPELSRWQRLLQAVGGSVARTVSRAVGERVDSLVLPTALPSSVLVDAKRELGWLADVAGERRKPFTAVVHCLCESP